MSRASRVGVVDVVTWARELAAVHLADAVPRRWRHVQAVADQAERASRACGPDADLLVAAALLHDVGYAPALVSTGIHALDGARYLRSIDADERLCGLVAHHSSAATDAELAGLTAEIAEFEDEQTPVRDALWWADMTVGPDGDVVAFPDRMAEVRARYGPDHPVSRALDKSMPEREAAVQRTEARLRALDQV